jgi:peroxiredoxin Q/BCP
MKIGDRAPKFSLKDAEEQVFSLDNFKGKYVVLYFYPKDNTSGCTLEALDFSRLQSEFKMKNAVVIGVSKDSCQSHRKFIDIHKLTVLLLSDSDSETQKKYGVWRPKRFMGREFLGTIRATFLIDPSGKIVHIWDSVSVKGHAEDVLDRLQKIVNI